jgi:molybdopterin-biosynthesis enzyme MoeA-like protein
MPITGFAAAREKSAPECAGNSGFRPRLAPARRTVVMRTRMGTRMSGGCAGEPGEDGLRRFGLYVIGDEILSGRRSDRHLPQVIAMLGKRGLSLSWAQFLPDDRAALEAALRISFGTNDVVFSCGGIGATPDDHTRQAAAAALDTELELHPGARMEIAKAVAKRGLHDLSTPEGRRVLMMGEFPRGARLIPNPYNRIPGFAVGSHYFVPGFPVMAWPMIEWVLDNQYRDEFHREPHAERSLLLFGVPESNIIPLMSDIESRFPGVRSFSLPSVGDGSDGRPSRRHIEFGVKGPPAAVAEAFAFLQAQLQAMGAEVQAIESASTGAAAQQ